MITYPQLSTDNEKNLTHFITSPEIKQSKRNHVVFKTIMTESINSLQQTRIGLILSDERSLLLFLADYLYKGTTLKLTFMISLYLMRFTNQ